MWTPLVSHGCLRTKNKPADPEMNECKPLMIGIVGVGGLGTMGLKIASSMGHDTVAFTRFKDKEQVCIAKGAKQVCFTSDEESIKEFVMSCDLIIDTVSFQHNIDQYLTCLKKKGKFHAIGGVSEPMK